MNKNLKKKEKINFLLENKHYKKLHLLLYFSSLAAIVFVYFLTVLIFSSFTNMLITTSFSVILGIFLVLHRDKLVKKISDFLTEKKRKDYKKNNSNSLKTTLKKIGPKSNLKLDLNKNSKFKIKVSSFKIKIPTKKKKGKGYLEIKD